MNIRRTTAVGLCVAAAWVGLFGPSGRVLGKAPAPKAVDAEQLKALMKKVEGNAELWAEGKTEQLDKDVAAGLRAVTYDSKTFAIVKGMLGAHKRPTTEDLYVLNAFLSPLTRAERSVIRSELPWVRMVAQVARYRPYRKYSPAQLKALKPPDAKGLDPEKMIQVIEKVRAYQDKKLALDRVVERHNEQAFELRSLTIRLGAMADDPAEDKRLLSRLVNYERQGYYEWFVVSQAIRSEAKAMTQERAQKCYDAFRKLGNQLKWTHKHYRHCGKGRLSPAANSDCATVPLYVGLELLQTVNLLATPAKEPAIKVPTVKEVLDHQKKVQQQRARTGR